MIDNSGKICFWNKAAENLFGYASEEILDKKLMETIIPTRYIEVFKNGFARFKNTGQKIFLDNIIEIEGLKKDGKEVPIEISVCELNLKENWYALAIIRDISRRVTMEKKLRYSEVKYREAYESANFYKDLFTHDINNIINNIRAIVQFSFMYLDKIKDLDKINEMLNSINDQIIRSVRLISNIRKLSQLEENDIVIQKIDAKSMLESAISFLKKSYSYKVLEISIENNIEKTIVFANELLLDAFENILINAIKYNNNHIPQIVIRISRMKDENVNYLKFEFIDNGLGIPVEKRWKIIQKGYNEVKSGEGMGIGLSLIKKIIDSYYGQIKIESRVFGDHTKGTNVIIFIPEAD